jgi:hypothetical protein
MSLSGIRLSKPTKFWVFFVYGGLFLSGVFWFVLHKYFTSQNLFLQSSHPWESFGLKVHGAFAFMSLAMIGALFPVHIARAWQARRNRLSGAFFLGMNFVLILTGYGLYYVGGEAFRGFVHFLHLYIGLALPLGLFGHIWRGKISRKKTSQPF